MKPDPDPIEQAAREAFEERYPETSHFLERQGSGYANSFTDALWRAYRASFGTGWSAGAAFQRERVDAERARANQAEDDYDALRVELATERTTHAVRLDHMIWLDQRVKSLEAERDAQRARAEKAEQLLGEKVVELEDAEDSAVEAHRVKNSAEARVRKLELQAAPLARLRELWHSVDGSSVEPWDEDPEADGYADDRYAVGLVLPDRKRAEEFHMLLLALLSPTDRAEGEER